MFGVSFFRNFWLPACIAAIRYALRQVVLSETGTVKTIHDPAGKHGVTASATSPGEQSAIIQRKTGGAYKSKLDWSGLTSWVPVYLLNEVLSRSNQNRGVFIFFYYIFKIY